MKPADLPTSLDATSSQVQLPERGRDSSDLARIRDRLAIRDAELAAVAQEAIDVRDDERRLVAELDAQAEMLEAAARRQERANAGEATDLLLRQAALGLGAFVAGTLFRALVERLVARREAS